MALAGFCKTNVKFFLNITVVSSISYNHEGRRAVLLARAYARATVPVPVEFWTGRHFQCRLDGHYDADGAANLGWKCNRRRFGLGQRLAVSAVRPAQLYRICVQRSPTVAARYGASL